MRDSVVHAASSNFLLGLFSAQRHRARGGARTKEVKDLAADHRRKTLARQIDIHAATQHSRGVCVRWLNGVMQKEE